PDRWGRVVLRPLLAGLYTVATGRGTGQGFANYYDAIESGTVVTQSSVTRAAEREVSRIPPAPRERPSQPMLILLGLLAMLALLAESAMLARRAARWGLGHV